MNVDDNELTNEEVQHGDPEFAEVPEKAEAEPEAKVEGEEPEGEPKPEVKAEGDGGDKIDQEDVEQLRKTVETLGRRVKTLALEKRDISKKLQETIAAVPQRAEAPEVEAEQIERADFKSKAEFDAAVKAEGARVAAQNRAVEVWNEKCNAVEDAGSKAFKDGWAKAKANLAVLDDEGRIPMDLLSTALETDNPAQVLFALGADLDKAAELMAMTPAKRAIAMDRMAQAKPAARPRSQAPDPIDPITGKGGGNDAPSDRDSDAEWHRKEGLREAARRRERLGLAK